MKSQDPQYGSVAKAFSKVDKQIRRKAKQCEVRELVQKVDMLSWCPDFRLSDPPTVEEMQDINNMEDGTLYTINGGSSVKIFRRRSEVPSFNAVSFPSAQSPSHRDRYEKGKPIHNATDIPFDFYNGLREVPQKPDRPTKTPRRTK